MSACRRSSASSERHSAAVSIQSEDSGETLLPPKTIHLLIMSFEILHIFDLMITEKVLLCGNTLMKCCCGATLYFLRQGARSKASNFILCLELY